MEILQKYIMLGQCGNEAPQDLVLTLEPGVDLAGPGPDPRAEELGQQRLPQDREAETPHPDIRQPADDLPVVGDDRGVPGARSNGIEPPWLLEQSVRAVNFIAVRSCSRRGHGVRTRRSRLDPDCLHHCSIPYLLFACHVCAIPPPGCRP